MTPAIVAALFLSQVVDPNDKQAVVTLACTGGTVEAFEGLGKTDDTIRQTRAKLRCEGTAMRLFKDGTIPKEPHPVEFGCGMGVGIVFRFYDLDDEITPTLSVRALKFYAACTKNVHEMLKPKPKKKP